MTKDTVVTLFRYKQWADAETLRAIKLLDEHSHTEKRHLTLRLMNHIYVVDMIFRANITGQEHGYTALNTPETPSCEELEGRLRDCTEWYIEHVGSISDADLDQMIKFRFVDGGAGEMKPLDMLNHVLFHGTYHRGAVGWLISESGGTPPKDVMTVFLRDYN
ncbi:DinB family protein [Erwiniaceae bacterium BAC15a-03b]|uniref:DinB family protein n=1 Tax=Winslowiella arboricola TaxID=2978220 RepID=A0A9J6PJJ1_9GAMM|nr:DinB family protein [Winslowiella arboricola]MCU5771595.1 DinB family protein [Winslowiella arboricola]MCU5775933.1 DinB family protein [Winslowiella arboricola]